MKKKVFILFILLSVFSLMGFVLVLENSINRTIDKDEQNDFFNEIQTSKVLPDFFINTIENYYPDYFQKGVWNTLISQFLNLSDTKCRCRDIYFKNINHEVKFAPEIVALELEERFSQRKCYEYDMQITDFGTNIKGIENAVKYYYQKEIKDLDEREILELNILRKAPVYYNSLKGKEKMKLEISKLIERYSEK